MADRRAQIEARLAEATPGPWQSDGVEGRVHSDYGVVVDGITAWWEADADLIAHAPADLRWLLDALAEAEAERERWKEVADAADDVIRAVLAALYRGPDTGAVIRAKKVMAERDTLAAKLAAVEGLVALETDTPGSVDGLLSSLRDALDGDA